MLMPVRGELLFNLELKLFFFNTGLLSLTQIGVVARTKTAR